MNLIIKTYFDAAHYLENYQGKCSNIHGHRWEVEVYLKVNPDKDMTIDFGDAKRIINNKLPDHQYLNEIYDFNPTAENIVKHLKKELESLLPVEKIIVWESPTSGAVI